MKGNSFTTYTGRFYNEEHKQYVNVEMKDSYEMISMPLRSFGKAFNLSVEKDVMPYDLYTEYNVEKRYIDNNEFLNALKEEDRQQAINNIIKWKCIWK